MFRVVVVAAASIAGALFVTLSAPASGATTARAHEFRNCTDMHRVYQHGVGRVHAHDHVSSGSPVTNFKRSNALYKANKKSDADGDHVACEAH